MLYITIRKRRDLRGRYEEKRDVGESDDNFYQFYRTWCEETGHHAEAISSFSREFKRLTEDQLIAVRRTKERGYQLKDSQLKDSQQKVSIFNGDGFDELLCPPMTAAYDRCICAIRHVIRHNPSWALTC